MKILIVIGYLQIIMGFITLSNLLYEIIHAYIWSNRPGGYCFSNWKKGFMDSFLYIIAFDFVCILMIIVIGIL